MGTNKKIVLITFGHFEKTCLQNIAQDVSVDFPYPLMLKESHIDLVKFYDPNRRQYDGNKLLKVVQSSLSPEIVKGIGLFRVDLFIPILTFVFGQAYFKGTAGIASLYRLKNEQYGMKKDDALLFDRFRKVIIHELGHTFGLVHCLVPDCVMRSSTYVEDIDQKKHTFCRNCMTVIHESQV
ncbi:MAG: archaemetzincin family Zn-dependent metalloprotease [Bacteroidales bacterium]|nr:archaemetzincin family Zn-dependent metalloprotease [Bacteroidales bacterium]MCF8402377.1 archaemetzincin family Zn-dependent metalloprotease [Bacteroidales bacterium]